MAGIWDVYLAGGNPFAPPEPNKPGIVSDMRRGVGQTVSGIGSAIRDVPGLDGVGTTVEDYGDSVVRKNPSQINGISDLLNRPGTAVREAVGEMVPQLGGQLATGFAGARIGGAIGGALLGPPGAVGGAAIGGLAGAAIPLFAGEYGEARKGQREEGVQDIPRAVATGAAGAALEYLGPEQMVSKIATKGLKSLARPTGESFAKWTLKQGGYGAAVEGITEPAQTALSRFGGYQDVTGPEAMDDYAVSAFKGAAGGGFTRAGLSALAGQQRPPISPVDPTDLLNPPAPTAPAAPGIPMTDEARQMDFGFPVAPLDFGPPTLRDAFDMGGVRTPVEDGGLPGMDTVDPRDVGPPALPNVMGSGTASVQSAPPSRAAPPRRAVSTPATAPAAPAPPLTSGAQVAATTAATNQQAVATEEERVESTTKYGGTQPVMSGDKQIGWTFLGKNYFTKEELDAAVGKVVEAEREKTPLQKQVERAYLDMYSGPDKTPLTPGSLNSRTKKFLNGAPNIETVLARVNAELETAQKGDKPNQARIGELENLRDNLMGVPADQRKPSTATKPAETKAPEVQATTGKATPSDVKTFKPNADGQLVDAEGNVMGTENPFVAEVAAVEPEEPEAQQKLRVLFKKAFGERDANILLERHDGTEQSDQAIGAKFGLERSSVAKIRLDAESPNGVQKLKEAAASLGMDANELGLMLEQTRPKEAVEDDMSPGPVVLDQASLFSNEDGAEQTMGTVASAGGSQGETAEKGAASSKVAALVSKAEEFEALAEKYKGNNPKQEAKMRDEAATLRAQADMLVEEEAKAEAERAPNRKSTVEPDKKKIKNFLPKTKAGQYTVLPQDARKASVGQAFPPAINNVVKGLNMRGVPTTAVPDANPDGLSVDIPVPHEVMATATLPGDWSVQPSEIGTRITRPGNSVVGIEEAGAVSDAVQIHIRANSTRAGKAATKPADTKPAVDTPAKEKVVTRAKKTVVAPVEKKENIFAPRLGEATPDRAERLWNAQRREGVYPEWKDIPEKAQASFVDTVNNGMELGDQADVDMVAAEIAKPNGKFNSAGNNRVTGTPDQTVTLDELASMSPGVANLRTSYESLGLGSLLKAVKQWVVGDAGGENGTLEQTRNGAKLTLNRDIANGNLHVLTQWVASHEVGHAIDIDSTGSPTYSATADLGVVILPKTNTLMPVGRVAKEMHELYKRGGVWAKLLEYPFDLGKHSGSSRVVVQAELFAQLWAAYTTPKTREQLRTDAPAAFALMERVAAHATEKFGGRVQAGQGKAAAQDGGAEIVLDGQLEPDLQRVASKGNSASQAQDFIRGMNQKQSLLSELLPKKGDVLHFRPSTGGLQGRAEKGQTFVVDGVFQERDKWKVAGRLFNADGSREFGGFKPTPGNPNEFKQSDLTAFYLVNFEETKDIGIKLMNDKLFSKGDPGKLAEALSSVPFSKDLPEPLRKSSRSIATTIKDTLKKGLFTAAITEDLADMAEKSLPSVRKYIDAGRKMMAARERVEHQLDKIQQGYDGLRPTEKGVGAQSANQLIYDSTFDGKWAFEPDWLTKAVTVDPAMQARFDRMSPAAQKLIKDVFRHGHEMLESKKALVKSTINAEYDAQLADKDLNDKAKGKIESQRSAQLKRFDRLMSIKADTPYAPLKRFGNYFAVGRSAEYEQAVADKDRKLQAKLESDPNHFVVSFYETLGEAEAGAATIEQNPAFKGRTQHAEKSAADEALFGGSDLYLAFGRLRNLVTEQFGESGEKSPSVRAISSTLNELYLRTLSEASARQSENRRRNVAGADSDMMRAFITQGRADAHFVGSMAHNDEVVEALTAMRKEAKVGDRAANTRYLNEFMHRYADGMDYKPTRVQDAIRRVTSIWMLSTSPAYYFQQATQSFVLSLPVMGGRHGYTTSTNALLRAYNDIAPLVRSANVTERMDFSKAPPDLRPLLQAMVESGKIDIGLNLDLGRIDSENAVWNTVDRKIRGFNDKVESINRAATAIAAYRMELAKTKSPEIAIKYAERIIHQTHGSYDGFNHPRLMGSLVPGSKVLFQFKKFQIIQLSLLARLFNNSFKAATPEERAMARKSMGFLLAHAFTLGGLMGLPGATALLWIAGKLFGDEDEPDDPELTLRRMIGDPTLATLLIRGMPASAGVDLSGRLGMGNALSVLPFTDIDLTTRSGYEKTLTAATGPFFGGLMPRGLDGLGQIGNGEYYKGLEALLPNGVANALKGMRFAAEGVTMRNGDMVLNSEEIGMATAAFQMMGLPTTMLTDRQRNQASVANADKFYNERTTELKSQYVRAVRADDNEARSEAIDAWQKLQEKRVENGYARQPMSTLMKAPQEAAKRQQKAAGGIEYNRNNRRFVEELAGQ